MNKILILLIAIFLLIGCRNLTGGVVVDKEFTPAHTTIHLEPTQVGEMTVTTPRIKYHKARWEVKIQDTHKGKLTTETHKVNKALYDSARVGEYIKIK